MIHYRAARSEVIAALRDETPAKPPFDRVVLIDDIFGKVRALVWFAEKAPVNTSDNFVALMRRHLGIYWAGLWVANDANEADRKLYEDLWQTSNEVGPSLRISERTRSHGFWMWPRSEPAWPVGDEYPPVIAFYSFKGGVGRTTALASFAIQRARTGETVVVVDLDLDAPGAGRLLGPGSPSLDRQFGVVDYLLESPINEDTVLSDYYYRCLEAPGTAPTVSIAGSGQILVFAAGSMDRDYLAMLARLNLEPTPDRNNHPLSRLLHHGRTALKPDWILLDCRAGLSQASGFALSGLANLTVLFGTTSGQSWDGLRLVIERLGAERIQHGLPQSECLIVQTMTPENPQTAQLASSAFRADAENIFKEAYYAEDPADEDDDRFWYVRDMEDDDSPHRPTILSYSQRLAFIRSIEDVADSLAESLDYSRLARRISSRFAKEQE